MIIPHVVVKKQNHGMIEFKKRWRKCGVYYSEYKNLSKM